MHQSCEPYHPHEEDRISKLEDTLVQFMQLSMINQRNTEASIKRLEDQMRKLANMVAEHGRDMVESQGEVEESDEEEKKQKNEENDLTLHPLPIPSIPLEVKHEE